MVNDDDPYQFALDNDTISNTPRTRSTSRHRQLNAAQIDNNNKKKATSNKRTEKSDGAGQSRVATRSSQRSQKAAIDHVDNDQSFMSDIRSGFSQFINPKKRPREEKKVSKAKRSRKENYADENEEPSKDMEHEIESIERIKLVYETNAGRTNIAKASVINDQIIADRAPGQPVNKTRLPFKDTTYVTHKQVPNTVEETQTDTLAIPDTLMHNDSQLNDSSWQKDIDRLMKKLEEPSSSCLTRSQVEIDETQIQDDHENNDDEDDRPSTFLNLTEKTQRVTNSICVSKPNVEPDKQEQNQLADRTEQIAVQTEESHLSASTHACCQDISTCPCVLRYSKLERLFMEKMSKFISIVPTIQNPPRETLNRTRPNRSYSRWRRFRSRRPRSDRVERSNLSSEQSWSNDENQPIEEKSSPKKTEINCQSNEKPTETKELAEKTIEERSSLNSSRHESTSNKENPIEGISELSTIERMDTTINPPDHPSTLTLSIAPDNTTNFSVSTDRRFVLTASSLDENQKIQYRDFVSKFHLSTTSNVDSSTSHVIVSEHSSLICPLTGKVIQGIARHLFVVSFRWIVESLKAETMLDEGPFEIRGDTSLGSDHGGMRRSRLNPSDLLSNYSICLRCSSSDCAPLQNVEQVQELIELCGGKLFHHFSQIQSIDKQRDVVLVLGINGFQGSEKKRQALLDTCQQFNVKCVNIHWLLISIAKYDIQSFDLYDIN